MTLAGRFSPKDGAVTAVGTGKLRDATNLLGAGAAAVAAGVDQVTGIGAVLEEAQDAYARVNAALDDAIAQLERVGGPDAEELINRAREAQAQVDLPVDPKTQQLIETALDPETADKLNALREGANKLSDQLNDPAAEYVKGINDAVDGAQKLSEALHLLHDGSGQLVAGTAQLTDGTSKLVVGVHTAAEKTPMLQDSVNQLVVGVDALNEA